MRKEITVPMLSNRIEETEVKRFGIIASGILFAYGAILLFKGRPTYYPFYLFSGVILVLSVLFPKSMLPLYILLRLIGRGISWLVTKILFTLVFYLLVTPIGLCMRVFKKGPFCINFKEDKPTYWVAPERKDERVDSYVSQF